MALCHCAAGGRSGRSVRTILIQSLIKCAYTVLPEVFGVNAWVRSVADRLAAHGYLALAVPLLARTAPDLEFNFMVQSGSRATSSGRNHG